MRFGVCRVLDIALLAAAAVALSATGARAQSPTTASQLADPSIQRRLIAAGMLDDQVGRAKLNDLRCARWRLKGASEEGCESRSAAKDPLEPDELAWLEETEKLFEQVLMLERRELPALRLHLLLPRLLVQQLPETAATADGIGWIELQRHGLVEYDVFRERLYKNTPATLLTGNMTGWSNVSYARQQLSPDETTLVGEGQWYGTRYRFHHRVLRGSDNAFGFYMKARAALSVGQARALLDRAPGLAELLKRRRAGPKPTPAPPSAPAAAGDGTPPEAQPQPVTPIEMLQQDWHDLIVSLFNLTISQLAADTSSVTFGANEPRNGDNCTDVRATDRSAPHSTETVIFGTDRNLLTPPTTPLDLTKAFGGDPSGQLWIGCVRIKVPRDTEVRKKKADIAPAGQPGADPARYYLEAARLASGPVVSNINGLRATVTGHSPLTNYKRALLYVHGFNNSFADAITTGALIKAQAAAYRGPVFVFSWPSRGGVRAYVDDLDRSEQAEAYLRAFLHAILLDAGISWLDIVAHSMGSQLVLRALGGMEALLDRRLPPDERTDRFRFGQVVFVAPDVSSIVFRERIRSIAAHARRVTVYASSNDCAMRASRSLRGSGAAARAGGLQPSGQPLMPDPASTNVHMIDISQPSWWDVVSCVTDLQHSPHLGDALVIADIGRVLDVSPGAQRESQAKPSERDLQAMVPLAFKENSSITYWQLKR